MLSLYCQLYTDKAASSYRNALLGVFMMSTALSADNDNKLVIVTALSTSVFTETASWYLVSKFSSAYSLLMAWHLPGIMTSEISTWTSCISNVNSIKRSGSEHTQCSIIFFQGYFFSQRRVCKYFRSLELLVSPMSSLINLVIAQNFFFIWGYFFPNERCASIPSLLSFLWVPRLASWI